MIGGVTRRGSSPIWGPPPSCKEAKQVYSSGRLFMCGPHKQNNMALHVQYTFFVHFFVFTARLQREIPSRFYGGRKMHHKDFFLPLLNLSSVSKKLFKKLANVSFPAPESLLASYWPRTDLVLRLFSVWTPGRYFVKMAAIEDRVYKASGVYLTCIFPLL